MAREFNELGRDYVLAESSDAIMVWFLDIAHESIGAGSGKHRIRNEKNEVISVDGHVYLCSFNKSCLIGTTEYHPSGIRIALPGSSFNRGRLNAELVVSNVNTNYVSIIRSINSKPELTLSGIVITRNMATTLVNGKVMLGATVEYDVKPIRMRVGQAKYNARTMRLPLEIDARLNDVFQHINFDPHHCPGLYK